MSTPSLKVCFDCFEPVYEFEDNSFGCDCCKAVWTYLDDGWYRYTTEKDRPRYELEKYDNKRN